MIRFPGVGIGGSSGSAPANQMSLEQVNYSRWPIKIRLDYPCQIQSGWCAHIVFIFCVEGGKLLKGKGWLWGGAANV